MQVVEQVVEHQHQCGPESQRCLGPSTQQEQEHIRKTTGSSIATALTTLDSRAWMISKLAIREAPDLTFMDS
jgi:hypothetical protein